jgi:hypothetical protein
MGAERKVERRGREEPEETKISLPVPGGTMYVESLGRWVDNLMGDERIHRVAQEELAPHYLRQNETP